MLDFFKEFLETSINEQKYLFSKQQVFQIVKTLCQIVKICTISSLFIEISVNIQTIKQFNV